MADELPVPVPDPIPAPVPIEDRLADAYVVLDGMSPQLRPGNARVDALVRAAYLQLQIDYPDSTITIGDAIALAGLYGK